MSPTKALRIGVLLGDNLVEERVFRPGTPITFGQSLRCTLSVPVDGVPREHVLFDRDLVLHAPPGSAVKGTRERGKITIGDATVLFQEVAAPILVPKPQLPASVRGTLADRVDRRLAVVVGASLLVHLGIAGWAQLTELERDGLAEEVAARYEAPTYEIMEVTAPDFDVPTPGETGPGVAAPAKPSVQTPKPMKPIDRLPEPVDANAWAQLITGNTPGANGQNELPSRIPNTDLDRQIRNVNEQGRTPADASRTSRDPGMRIGDGPPGPTIEQPGRQEIAKTEKPPVTRITPIPQPKPPGKDPLSINLVLGRIQSAYMAGLQRCYVKHGLSTDAAMVAKVTISFVVDSTGTATENQAHGANAEIDACIRGQMTGWKFPVPKDDDGDPTDAPFKLQLALQPS